VARANDPRDDKTMRMPRPEVDVDDEKTIRVPRHDLGDEKTIRVQRLQDDWEPTAHVPMPGAQNAGMVTLPLDDPRHEPTIRMPRPPSPMAAAAQADWPPAAPALHGAAPTALREMPKLPPAAPLSRRLLWAGLVLAAVVLAVVAGMVIRV
jgi:hypothetical protein